MEWWRRFQDYHNFFNWDHTFLLSYYYDLRGTVSIKKKIHEISTIEQSNVIIIGSCFIVCTCQKYANFFNFWWDNSTTVKKHFYVSKTHNVVSTCLMLCSHGLIVQFLWMFSLLKITWLSRYYKLLDSS